MTKLSKAYAKSIILTHFIFIISLQASFANEKGMELLESGVSKQYRGLSILKRDFPGIENQSMLRKTSYLIDELNIQIQYLNNNLKIDKTCFIRDVKKKISGHIFTTPTLFMGDQIIMEEQGFLKVKLYDTLYSLIDSGQCLRDENFIPKSCYVTKFESYGSPAYTIFIEGERQYHKMYSKDKYTKEDAIQRLNTHLSKRVEKLIRSGICSKDFADE